MPAASPQELLANGGRGPMVSILTWFLTIMMVLSVFTRLGIRLASSRIKLLDDGPICVAALFCIAECISTSIGAANGLGKHQDDLDADQITQVYKAQFASDILYIPTLVTAQMSTLLLIESIPASKTLRTVIRWTNIANVIWAVPAMLALIISGASSHPLARLPDTINLDAFWIIVTIFNILIELNAFVMPCVCIIPLKTRLSKRLAIISSFAFGLLVVAALIARLHFFVQIRNQDSDVTHKLASYSIATQFVLTLAITNSSIPILSHFLENFETGMLGLAGIANDGSYGRSDGPNARSNNTRTNSNAQNSRMDERTVTHVQRMGSMAEENRDITITTEVKVQRNEKEQEGMKVHHTFQV